MPPSSPTGFSIGEVARRTGLEAHVLRHWEAEFDALRPRKNAQGHRVYTEADVVVVERIQRLLHRHKYTTEGARQVLARPDPPAEARKELLKLRAFLARLLQTLDDAP